MLRPSRVFLAPLALALSLSACGDDASDATAGSEDRVQVATGFYALEYLAERIGGEHAEATSLTGAGQDPHDAELSVAQTAEVAEADLVVHLAGFQPVVDDAVAEVAEGTAVDVSASADLAVTGSEHEHQEGHDEDEAHAEEGAEDPHFWLDPQRMAAVGGQLADALAEADPDHADDYRANLEALEQDLAALETDLEALADCERDVVVVSHDAFGYLAQHTGLDFHAIAGISPGAEPSVQHLQELQELIESEGLTTVFTEPLNGQQMAQTLSSDLGLETAVLDPIEGLTDETADEDYLSLMRTNLTALQEANGCR